MSLRRRARRLRRKARAAMTPQNIARIGSTAFLGPVAGPLVADFVLEGSLPNVRDLTNPATLASFAGVDPNLVQLSSNLIQNGSVDFKSIAAAAGIDVSLINNINDLKNFPNIPDNIKNALDRISDIENLFDDNLSENEQLTKLQNIFDNSNVNVLVSGNNIIKKLEDASLVINEQKDKLPKNWNVSYLTQFLQGGSNLDMVSSFLPSIKGNVRSLLLTNVSNFLPTGLPTNNLNFSTAFGRNKLSTATQRLKSESFGNLNRFFSESVSNRFLGFFDVKSAKELLFQPPETFKKTYEEEIKNAVSIGISSSNGSIFINDPFTSLEYLNIVNYNSDSFDEETNIIINFFKNSSKNDSELIEDILEMY